MKKCLLLVAAMICLNVQGFAHDFEAVNDDGVTIYYNITSNYYYTVEVTYRGSSYDEYDEYAGDVVIPYSVCDNDWNYYDVSSIGEMAFRGCSSLTSVNIPNSVTSIGDYAFSGCSTLTSINIPNSVKYIQDYAFYNCSSLTSVNIPNLVTSIGDYAFSGCSTLTSINIPNSVKYIQDYAFYNCSSLTSVNIPNSVTSIGDYTFFGCSSLTSFVVDSGNTSYETMENGRLLISYTGNEKTLIAIAPSGLTSITIPNSVTGIGERVFYNCSSLTSVTIGNSVTSIGRGAFDGCSSLTSITIPNSVTGIGERVFYNCSSLTSVTIGNSITGIGEYTFFGCSSLTSVTIGNSVTSIGRGAFDGCSSLISITIPNSVTSIEGNAFRGCSSLTSVNIPNSVTSIGNSAFDGCSSLTSITIPNSVTSIEYYIFRGCSSLASFVVDSGNTSYETMENGRFLIEKHDNKKTLIAFAPSGLTSITIPNSVTSIGTGAFSGCSSLTSITIPNSVTSIGACAFRGCSSLTSFVVDSGNISYETMENGRFLIDKYDNKKTLIAFAPSGLTSITIPNSVTGISSFTFMDCSSLTSVTIGNSVTSIGGWAFENCSGLTSITIPNSVTKIGESAFYNTAYYNNTSNWTDSVLYIGTYLIDAYYISGAYTIIDGTTCLADYAFSHNSLTSVSIPSSIKNIGISVLYDCDELTSIFYTGDIAGWCGIYIYSSFIGGRNFYIDNQLITDLEIPNSVTSIGDYAFSGCSSLTSVTIPDSVTSIGDYAFSSNNLTSVTIPNSVTSIGDYAFSSNSLTSVTIPNSVTSIGDNVFFNCRNLTSAIIGNSVTIIGGVAFGLCSNLTSVTIGNSVTSIGGGAFFGCSSLTSINSYAMTPPTCGGSFGVVPTDISLTVPCGCGDAYRAAAEWSNFTNIIELPCDVAIAVSASPSEYGTVSGGGNFTTGDIVTVTATANDGYHFESWTEDGYIVSTNATYSFTAILSQNLVANFAVGIGLEEKSLQNFAIYPNPTTGIVNLDVEDVQCVEIMDINGRIINKVLYTNNIDLSDFDKGIYILRISLPQGSTMRRVVKM